MEAAALDLAMMSSLGAFCEETSELGKLLRLGVGSDLECWRRFNIDHPVVNIRSASTVVIKNGFARNFIFVPVGNNRAGSGPAV